MKNKYLRHGHVSEGEFRRVVQCFAQDVSALTAARLCGVNKNTTHRLYTLLRQRVVALAAAEAQPFVGGSVEMDERYLGPRRVRGQRGRGAARKIPVMGRLKRAGKVFTQIVKNGSKNELLPVVQGQVKGAATLPTDGWKAYDGLVLDGFKHDRVHHHENELARGKRPINGIESFWGFCKTRLAKQRGIRTGKFPLHLKESEWRWNHRQDNLYRLLLAETRHLPLN